MPTIELHEHRTTQQYSKLLYIGIYKKWESPNKTVKWETENTVLCESVLIQDRMPKIVLSETLLYTMRGIELYQKRKDAQNAENGFLKKIIQIHIVDFRYLL